MSWWRGSRIGGVPLLHARRSRVRASTAWAQLALTAVIAAGVTLGDARTAHAQELVVTAAADVCEGIEGGAGGYAKGVRRARTTLRLGAEGYVDEMPNDQLSVAALVELEPKASIGADLRYQRMIEDYVALHVGAIGVIAPKNMLGVTLGGAFRWWLLDQFALSFGVTGNVFFLGSDLPSNNVLWQAMGQVGVRAKF